MTIHPIRLSGLVIGVPQTYSTWINAGPGGKIRNLSLQDYRCQVQGTDVSTGELARDIGTVLVGKDAVEVGLIDAVGGIKEAVAERTPHRPERSIH